MVVQQTKSKDFWTVVNAVCVGIALVLIPVFYSKSEFLFVGVEALALAVSGSWLIWGRSQPNNRKKLNGGASIRAALLFKKSFSLRLILP